MVPRWRKMIVLVSMLAVMAPMLSGCSVWRGVREAFGYQTTPPNITEKHLSPCLQPHRGSPQRDCSGERKTYTPRPAEPRQIY